MSVTVKLRRPIKAHGETISELTFREPRGKDIAACGMPRVIVRRGKSISFETDAAVIHEYIVTLANIPPTSADQIAASDWDTVTGAVMGFFAPTDESSAGAVGVTADPAADEAKPSSRVPMPFQDSST